MISIDNQDRQLIAFNGMYKMPAPGVPTLPSLQRLKDFRSILAEELTELDDIIAGYEIVAATSVPDVAESSTQQAQRRQALFNLLVDFTDFLTDVRVYCGSEAVKTGVPPAEAHRVVMDSNFSKLGEDGLPIYDERGKVQKGPNYWKPEPKLADLILGVADGMVDFSAAEPK